MKKERRTVVYDDELQIEAYHFAGTRQPFPNHFHEYYVIGFVEDGERCLSCKNKEYKIEKGTILLFHPGDNHACVQSGDGTFDYRGFHIAKSAMLDLAEEVTGKRELPGFSENVMYDDEIACYLRQLHEMVMNGNSDFGKEENLLILISTLIQHYGQLFESCVPECRQEIERACAFIREHFHERIYLDQICRYAGLSKSTLLRAFTKSKGVTPYRYLETIRINEAKTLLRDGVQPVEAAMRTGFSDQSHFTNYFNRFIGLAPGAYRDIFFDKNKDGEARHEE
ncbi:MAG: AraC family transcriptional regulator [Eubacteriales bacterium]|nr:AraC family transcriptional regulator [Eubacteriales bacterium]